MAQLDCDGPESFTQPRRVLYVRRTATGHSRDFGKERRPGAPERNRIDEHVRSSGPGERIRGGRGTVAVAAVLEEHERAAAAGLLNRVDRRDDGVMKTGRAERVQFRQRRELRGSISR